MDNIRMPIYELIEGKENIINLLTSRILNNNEVVVMTTWNTSIMFYLGRYHFWSDGRQIELPDSLILLTIPREIMINEIAPVREGIIIMLDLELFYENKGKTKGLSILHEIDEFTEDSVKGEVVFFMDSMVEGGK